MVKVSVETSWIGDDTSTVGLKLLKTGPVNVGHASKLWSLKNVSKKRINKQKKLMTKGITDDGQRQNKISKIKFMT